MSPTLLSSVFACLACATTQASSSNLECFSTKPSNAAFVVQENVSLLVAPTAGSSLVASAFIGDQVCTLSQQSTEGATWIFVQSYSLDGRTHQPLRGWIPESALAYWSELQPIRDINVQEVTVEIGDYHGEYKIYKGGKFILPLDEGEYSCREHIGRCKAWLAHGQLLHKGDFVVAATGGTQFIDLFKRMPSGRLCPLRSEEPPPECSKQVHR